MKALLVVGDRRRGKTPLMAASQVSLAAFHHFEHAVQ